MSKYEQIDELRKKAAQLQQERKWDDLVNFFGALDPQQLTVDLLLLKAASIQLAEHDHGFSLSTAQYALEAACDIDPHGVEATIELAHFQFAVVDNPCQALSLFEEALRRSEKFYIQAVCGKAKVISENSGPEEAIHFLYSCKFSESEQVKKLIFELEADI